METITKTVTHAVFGSRNLGVSAVKLQKRRKMGFVFIITKIEAFGNLNFEPDRSIIYSYYYYSFDEAN